LNQTNIQEPLLYFKQLTNIEHRFLFQFTYSIMKIGQGMKNLKNCTLPASKVDFSHPGKVELGFFYHRKKPWYLWAHGDYNKWIM